MNIDNVPDEVWQTLINYFKTIKGQPLKLSAARLGSNNDDKAIELVSNYFYHNIYRKWAATHPGESYTYNKDVSVMEIEWKESHPGQTFVYNKNVHMRKMGEEWSQFQADALEVDKQLDTQGLALFESYNPRPVYGLRLQFLVHMGGGAVLFNRMRRACHEYRSSCRREKVNSVIDTWKVFGEMFHNEGQSEACVVYFNCYNFDNREVRRFVIDYLVPHTYELVDHTFRPIGLVRIPNAGGYWFATQPDRQQWLARFAFIGEDNDDAYYRSSSAGRLMGLVLAHSIVSADHLNPAQLMQGAKNAAKNLVNTLNIDINPFMTVDECVRLNQKILEITHRTTGKLPIVDWSSGTLRGLPGRLGDMQVTRL